MTPSQRSHRIIVAFSLLFIAALIAEDAPAQENGGNLARHAIYAEAFGQGLLYSINYDYRLLDQLSLRAGFTSWTIHGLFYDDMSFTGFPVMANYLTGEGTSHLELGIGVVPVSIRGSDFLGFSTGQTSVSRIVGTATLGYRAQAKSGGFIFRIGLTPFFNTSGILLSGGASIGVAF